MERETLIHELKHQFPEYEFFTGRRLFGKCIVAKQSRYLGAEIYIRKNGILVTSAIPEMKTRLLLGGSAMFVALFNKSFHIPKEAIFGYLNGKYMHVRMKK